MSNTSFNERLQRIQANADLQKPSLPDRDSRGGRAGRRGRGLVFLVLGAIAVMIASQTLKFSNEQYTDIRDRFGMGAVAGLGLVSIAIGLTGIVMTIAGIYMSLFPARKVPLQPGLAAELDRRPTRTSKTILSLLGFGFGLAACLSIYTTALILLSKPEKMPAFVVIGVIIAFCLALISLLFGLIGLFARGRALWRVPVYFLYGFVLTFVTCVVTRVNFLEWEVVAAQIR